METSNQAIYTSCDGLVVLDDNSRVIAIDSQLFYEWTLDWWEQHESPEAKRMDVQRSAELMDMDVKQQIQAAQLNTHPCVS